MKKAIILTAVTAMLFSACSKSSDTQATPATPAPTNTTENSLTIDGTAMTKANTGSDTSGGFLIVYFAMASGGAEVCQVMFKETNPPTGTYPSNWTSALSASQSKTLLMTGGKQYWSEDGTSFTLTNMGSAKFRASFTNVVFNEYNNGVKGTGRKTVSGNFGNS